MSDHKDHDAKGHEHDHHEDHDHGPVFFNVFIGLCILTAMSFGVGNWDVTMSRPAVGWSLMMAISCAKALLVISFFMHLRWEANWKYVLTIPASIMSAFLVLMLVPDVMNRGAYATEERQRYQAAPQEHVDHNDTHVGHGAGAGHGDEHDHEKEGHNEGDHKSSESNE